MNKEDNYEEWSHMPITSGTTLRFKKFSLPSSEPKYRDEISNPLAMIEVKQAPIAQ